MFLIPAAAARSPTKNMTTVCKIGDRLVTFGDSINDSNRPDKLRRVSVRKFLDGISRGQWRPEIERVRSFPPHSRSYTLAKKALPFATLSGEFRQRSKAGLVKHSGIIAVDIDKLSPAKRAKVFQRTVADHYCLAAFHSVSGRGMWLLFHIDPLAGPPTAVAQQHTQAWRDIAAHVRNFYGVAPDVACKDVCRPTFVSWDDRFYWNGAANLFPVVLAPLFVLPQRSSGQARSARVTPKQLPPPKHDPSERDKKHSYARLIGIEHAPCRPKPDGTFYTHRALLKLSRRLAVLHVKGRVPDNDWEGMLDAAFFGWSNKAARQGRKLRHPQSTYRAELRNMFAKARKAQAVKDAANVWLQWRSHPKYPSAGTPRDRLLFAIRQHCLKQQQDEKKEPSKFFLGSRDAGSVAGVSNNTASKILLGLREQRVIALAGGSFNRRYASTYRLLD